MARTRIDLWLAVEEQPTHVTKHETKHDMKREMKHEVKHERKHKKSHSIYDQFSLPKPKSKSKISHSESSFKSFSSSSGKDFEQAASKVLAALSMSHVNGLSKDVNKPVLKKHKHERRKHCRLGLPDGDKRQNMIPKVVLRDIGVVITKVCPSLRTEISVDHPKTAVNMKETSGDVNKVSEVSSISKAPAESELPEVIEIPDVPEVSEIIEIPDDSAVLDAPEQSDVIEVPYDPKVIFVPDDPEDFEVTLITEGILPGHLPAPKLSDISLDKSSTHWREEKQKAVNDDDCDVALISERIIVPPSPHPIIALKPKYPKKGFLGFPPEDGKKLKKTRYHVNTNILASSLDLLDLHRNGEMPSGSSLECPQCSLVFSSIKHLKYHQSVSSNVVSNDPSRHHTVKDDMWLCPWCPVKCTTMDYLNRHKSMCRERGRCIQVQTQSSSCRKSLPTGSRRQNGNGTSDKISKSFKVVHGHVIEV